MPDFIAKRDPFGRSETFIRDKDGNLKPIISDANGAMKTTEGKRLKEVIEIDLSIAHTKLEFDKSFLEAAIAFGENGGNIRIYIDEDIESKGINVFTNMTMPCIGTKFYISNTEQAGKTAQIILLE